MNRFLALVLIVIAPVISAAQNNDAEFAAVTEEFIKGYLNARPLLATRLGFHEYDGRADDFSRLALDAELQRLRRFEDRLRKFEPEELNARNGIDLRILQAAIANELFEFQEVHKFERDPMTYAHCADLNIYIARNFAPLDDRVRSLTAIESQIPNILIAGKTNLESMLPKPHIELAIQIARGSADFLRKDMVAAVDAVKDQEVRGNFLDTNRKAANALSDFATWLEKERLPRATLEFGLGEARYQRWLTETELIDLPPEKILEIGLAKLKEEQKVFADAAKVIDPSKSPAEVFKQLQKEHPTAEKLIPEIAKNLDQIRSYVTEHKIVGIPPNAKAQVKETPQYDRATSFASMDTPGPFEKKATEAFYYVTPVESAWTQQQKEEWLTSFNYYTADVTSIHEAYPGHYAQFLRLNASAANKVEKIFGSYAFIEGWAHYCEQMMLDEGFGAQKKVPGSVEEQKRAAKYRMAQSSEALLRLCRLCVSVKMHTQGMGVDEATKFFQQNCYYEEKPARDEAMRGTFDYGYLNYSLGKMQIMKLREDYKAQQGDEFSLEQFHNQLLDHGMPPIRLLREILLKDKAKWDETL
ncbi:MAG: hypothetical protein DME45_03520 [Verrucomicrobia bacterium]|nr:MAG: hypothetical protein DME45_03520 [Verrucomicrobiota bacterium]